MPEVARPMIAGAMLRRRVLLAAISLLALGVGACAKASNTSSPNGAGAYRLVSRSAAKTEATKTAHMSMTMQLSGGGSGQSATVSAAGGIDFAHQTSSMTFGVSGIGSRTMHMNMRLVGGAIYMQLPSGLGRGLPSGKSWTKIDIAAISRQTGVIPGLSGGSMTAIDPSEELNFLRGVSKSVRPAGTETVRGVQTERYHVVIDPRRALAKVSGTARCGLGAAARVFGSTTIPADVWIDQQGRLRQMRMTIATPAAAGISMSVQMNLFDFGVPIHVSAPPASEVYDLTPQLAANIPSACTTT